MGKLSPKTMTHKFKGSDVNNHIVIEGAYDVNIWYSYDNNTKTTVRTETINYSESVMVNQRETTDSSTKDIIVRSLKQPNCSNATVEGNLIKFDIEKELGVEIVGDTKVKVQIEEDEEPWDLIEDDIYDDAVDKEISSNIDDNFIKKED